MYCHDYSQLEVVGDISDHHCILLDDFLVVVAEAVFGYW
jgi:hypothetical protein